MDKRFKKYDWDEIQKFYDSGKTCRDITRVFGVASATISKAKKDGKIQTRTMSESLKVAYKQNRKNRTLSDETKKKISIARKKFLKENPDKVPYLMNHYSKGDSYPEQYFEKCFLDTDIIKKHRVSTYELDFADLENMIDIEIDGEQHFVDPRIIDSDIRRNDFLTKCGWRIYRVRWSKFMKLNKTRKSEIINGIITNNKESNDVVLYIEGVTDREMYDKYFFKEKNLCEKCRCEIHKLSKHCNTCSKKRKFEVSVEKLFDLICVQKLPFTKVGERFGVTDNTIRKRCRKLGIDPKLRKMVGAEGFEPSRSN